MEDKDEQTGDEGVEDFATLHPREATARFYFTLTFALAKEDITKIKQIENMSVYLVLNTASLLKDKRIQEMNEIRKMEQKPKYV